jgi:hypothetical protein
MFVTPAVFELRLQRFCLTWCSRCLVSFVIMKFLQPSAGAIRDGYLGIDEL